MTFSEALEKIKIGEKVQRIGWNGDGMYIKLQIPTETTKMTLSYLSIKTADNNLVPWLASQTDLLSDDWEIV